MHFLVLGALLFGGYSYFETGQIEPDAAAKEIRLSLDELAQLTQLFQSQWQRAPTPEEFDRLLESRVQQEVLYREALAMGLVLDVVDEAALIERALASARQIAAHSPLAVWMTKDTMWQTLDSPSLRHAIDMENRTQVMCHATGELRESFTAFVEKRAPRWQPL